LRLFRRVRPWCKALLADQFVYIWKVKRPLLFLALCTALYSPAQDNQLQTQLQVRQLLEKKAEYHRLTGGQEDGYRIKIHFGPDREAAEAVRAKFVAKFPDVVVHKDYEQPYFVVLVGDFKTKLQAFETWKKLQVEFPSAFIVKGKINTR
jgi:hypothetical protein